MRPIPDRLRRPAAIVAAALAVVAGVVLLQVALTHRPGLSPGPRPSAAARSAEAYAGLGAWVDLWDAAAWRDPEATVADMASHGVRTIYLQSGNAKSSRGISNRAAFERFITEAHARDMLVVAWYLPNLRPGSVDFERVMQAIEFTTENGQRVDSFALDIESTAVRPISARNANLASLSARIREAVGPDYPLGAIIPSPVGLTKRTGFWDVFPYESVARSYDVLLPMAYYSFSGHTAKQARRYALSSMEILRAQPGCSQIPVHLIGGISSKSSGAEVRAFARAAQEAGCIGTSNYDWAGMTKTRWDAQAAGWKASDIPRK